MNSGAFKRRSSVLSTFYYLLSLLSNTILLMYFALLLTLLGQAKGDTVLHNSIGGGGTYFSRQVGGS